MKKSLLLLAAAAMPTLAGAQELKEGYISWPSSQSLATYVSQWNGGNGTIKINNEAWEDEEFFVSHVRPRVRFTNTLTQVYPNRLAYMGGEEGKAQAGNATDKRVAYWVCVGDEKRNNVYTNGLSNGVFDQEIFNMWSYIDNYGDWNCPWGWTPGAFADACHKNGVATHGVASVPYGGISDAWSNALIALGNLSSDAVGKFLWYHGQDGLGYNSEFSGGSTVVSKLTPLHNGLKTYMAEKNPNWEVMWYAGTNDNGSINFDAGIGNFMGLFNGASMFLNYNWNTAGLLSGAVNNAENAGKNPMLVYAGMNQQGGEPKSGSNYTLLKDYKQSIGLWAGHNNNMLWKNRQANGSSPSVKMTTYIHDNEMLFGNGKRNPAIKQTITDNRTHHPSESFAGYSSMVNARSTMKHTVKTEPFYTYFNLGNGTFFNWKGERMHNNEWYNIGVQDYMPTWRYWFAPKWLQTDVTEGTTRLSADFTWEDAYMGGSCLKITGSTTEEYLHLLKTEITPASGDTLTVRFKLLGGEGDVNLLAGSTEVPGTVSAKWDLSLMDVAGCSAIEDQSYKAGAAGWVTKSFPVASAMISNANLKGKAIGIIGLSFKNVKNMELLIGEISVKPRANTTTPAAPQVTLAKTLAYNVNGVDGKLIWKMANSKAVGEPCYNDEVNTSVFKVYTQQEGEVEQLAGMTTTWASHIFSAPVIDGGKQRIRFGVSAVSMDQRTESPIAWSDYMNLPGYDAKADIVTDKSVIKPGEEFTMSFVDPKMASGSWVIRKADTTTDLWSGSGKTVTCPGLAEEGAYDLVLTYSDSRATLTKTFPRYISISSTVVGALPDIYSLSIDGQDVTDESSDITIKTNTTMNFSYTGRDADGVASRGVSLDEKFFGVGNDQLGIQANKSFSVACWLRIDELPDVCNLLTIENITSTWPTNRWGYYWHRIAKDGTFLYDNVDACVGTRHDASPNGYRTWYTFGESKIDLGSWSHIAWVFEYSGTSLRWKFYINGKQQKVTQYLYGNKDRVQDALGGEAAPWSDLSLAKNVASNYGEDTYEPPYFNHSSWPLDAGTFLSIGGTAPNISAMKGSIDEYQVWGKAMTEAEIMQSMEGLDKDNLPADVLGFWDFETDANGDASFVGATGANASNKSPKAYLWEPSESGEAIGGRSYRLPIYASGCPFIAGEAYPIVTKPTWKTRGVQTNVQGTGVSGSADITFPRTTDYGVELTLENGHGSKTMSYPVVHVDPEATAIDGITADGGELKTYTVDGTLFIDFAVEGDYTVMVYDMAGMQRAAKQIDAVAGQVAQISLGTKGVYLVKVVKDGRELRTVKIINK